MEFRAPLTYNHLDINWIKLYFNWCTNIYLSNKKKNSDCEPDGEGECVCSKNKIIKCWLYKNKKKIFNRVCVIFTCVQVWMNTFAIIISVYDIGIIGCHSCISWFLLMMCLTCGSIDMSWDTSLFPKFPSVR